MDPPPGFFYTLRLLPYFTIPSAIVYGSFRLLQVSNPGIYVPTSVIVICTVLARPVLFYAQGYYTQWANRKAAAAHGAILAPHIKESALQIIPELISSTRDGYPGNMLYRWSRIHGYTFQFSLLTSSTVVTMEPEHIKAILANQFDAFEKGPTFISQMNSLLGTGVFNADGDMWKFHRAITRPFFTRERISDFDIYDRNCDLSLQEARKRLREGYPIDFQDLASRFTLDSASEFLFGANVGSLSAGIPYPPAPAATAAAGCHANPASYAAHPSTIFTSAFMNGQLMSVERIGLGKDWPLLEMMRDKIKPMREVLDGFTEPMMRRALERRDAEAREDLEKVVRGEGKIEREDETLLSHLVRQTQDPKIIKDELVNLLVAGRDTTMSLLTFSMYMLAEHPDIEKRLRQEIFEKVGANGRPTYDQMRDMRFMRAFLNEVLRLYPPVPVNMRTSNKPVILPSKRPGQPPIYVPADTSCFYSILDMQRRTDLWGPDALEFDPDRFLDERLHKYLTPNPFIFTPFNAGPRICLGQQFAYHEATFYLIRLLQSFTGFEMDSSTNTPPPAAWAQGEGKKATEKAYLLSHLTMYIKDGLWVKMRELGPSDL